MSITAAVILAAGKGTRMKSSIPKVLHKVAGKEMLRHVLEAAARAGVEKSIAVIGHGGDMVEEALGDAAQFVYQKEQLGTGHAVLQAVPALGPEVETVLVVCGDTPLLRGETLQGLLEHHRRTGAAATVLTASLADPTGYGRILRRPDGQVAAIVEPKDADPQVRAIREINTGTYCFQREALVEGLQHLTPANAQGEYYLTDVIAWMVDRGLAVEGKESQDPTETMGINDRVQLAEAEKVLRHRIRVALMEGGVTLPDPVTVYIDAQVTVGTDTVIYPHTFLEGETVIGSHCLIGPGTRIVNSVLGNGVQVQNSVILDSRIEDDCTIGPFAYIRPESHLGPGVKVGDFVELKKAVIGAGSKIPHLSYVGDAQVGAQVNVGAGTITCNYDGKKKHATVIRDGAFIGSNTNLVAPVEVGEGAVIGAGSTITKDVPSQSLALARSKQINIADWAKRRP